MIFLDKGLERLLDRYIREHCEKQKQHGIMATAGFLIGSKLNDDFHLAHIALCNHPDGAYDDNGDSYSKLIDAEWISDTGARVLRLLPGGLTIVGLLWLAGPKNSLQSAEIRAMLVRALAHILVNHNALSLLNINSADSLKVLIEIQPPLGKPQGYVVDCSRKGFVGSQTKVSFNQLEWVRLESSANLRILKPLADGVWDFHKQFTNAIREWADCLLATDAVLVDGCLRSRDEPLKPRDKKASNKNTFHIETFLDVTGNKEESTSSRISSFCTIDLIADPIVKAAVPSKATVGQAVDAVKEHIIRTLCSRAEIHYESTDVVEDEPNDRVSVHQLPRPGFASLPSQPAIVFTDYLFESDTASDAQQSFADLLTLTIPEDEIEIDSERLLDEGDLYSIVSDDEKPSRVERSSSSTSSLSSVVLPPIRKGTKKLPVNMYAIVAALVALLSFVVYILMKALSS